MITVTSPKSQISTSNNHIPISPGPIPSPAAEFQVLTIRRSGAIGRAVPGVDAEFSAIQTAVATKYDSGDVASSAQAIAGTSNSVLMTPLQVENWASDASSVVAHLQNIGSLATNGDKLFFFDDTDDTTKALTVGNGLEISGTTIQTPSATAGAGLTYSSGVLAVGAGRR